MLTQLTPPSTAYMSPATLAALAPTLLSGRRETSPVRTNSSLTAALLAGVDDTELLTQAAADDTALEFGIKLTAFGIVAYTPRLVVVGFNATSPTGRGAMTRLMQERADAQQIAVPRASPALNRDPFWGLWPWGLPDDMDHNTRSNWGLGVACLINSRYANAVMLFQTAADNAANIIARDLFWVRRALAADIDLATQYSQGAER